jgi:hypothetical protein
LCFVDASIVSESNQSAAFCGHCSALELIFRFVPPRRFTAVSLKTDGDTIEASAPRELFALPIIDNGYNPYDITPDGQRIVALMPAETAEAQQAQNQVTFLMNLSDKVRRRTATQTK